MSLGDLAIIVTIIGGVFVISSTALMGYRNVREHETPRGDGMVVGLVLIILLIVLLLVSQVPSGSGSTASNTPIAGTGSTKTPGSTKTAGSTKTPGSTVTGVGSSHAPTLPPAGTVICDFGENGNWDGWPIGGAWRLLNGMIVNNGSQSGSLAPSLTPPPACQPATPDYAVEATILDTKEGGDTTAFGIDVRSSQRQGSQMGYAAYTGAHGGAYINIENPTKPAQYGPFDFGSSAHVYRVEAKGNVIRFLSDSTLIVSMTDNTYLDPGIIGLFCYNGTQIQMTRFRVIIL
jgi:hypothetical protein